MPACPGCAALSMGRGRVSVSWARPGSGFTMLFEALVLTFAVAMPVAKVAAMAREHDTRIWRVLEHHVRAAREREDFSAVTTVGMDETSARTGQDYVSIVADMVRGRVRFATEGRRSDTVARFATDLAEHGGDPTNITETSSDMSTAFLRGIADALPNATMTFDRFHLAATLSDAVDAVRRAEVTTRPELTRTRWGVAEELLEPLGQAAGRAPPADAPLSQARALPGHGAGGRTSTPSTTRTPATPPPTCDAGTPAPHAPACSPSKTFVALVEKHWDARPRLAQKPPEQRPARRDQLPRPGSQSPRPRLPEQKQDDHHHLPHHRQTPPTHPHQPQTRIHDLTPPHPE
jgi:Transposase/Helix-turn-helix domain of transposase family ISL3